MTRAPAAGGGPGLREVLAIAATVVLVVLGVEALASLVPGLREAFRAFPVTVLVLVVGTGVVLGLVLRRPRARG